MIINHVISSIVLPVMLMFLTRGSVTRMANKKFSIEKNKSRIKPRQQVGARNVLNTILISSKDKFFLDPFWVKIPLFAIFDFL